PFWDKVESRFSGYDTAKFRAAGVRVVPGAIARRGSYFGKNVVLMPSFTNICAYVGEGTMIDTAATVGSCAQLGAHCHLSGSAAIGAVLEPLQASPAIIEDHCFIGARSEVVEGVIVGHHSVIGMGVFISQSTRIYNRATGEISYGYVPPYSVVVSGQLPAKDGTHSLYCAVIVKQVDEKTRAKTSINELLRGFAD
ncbi:MAG TPA: 2,3,4,5-tetrahydropyridine-2,6-dicarboxylate N-succinyltransferase, partial [Xylella fastidiosa subsp. pauca]